MKIYRYITKYFTATFDSHELLDRINNDFPELNSGLFKFNEKEIGINIENFARGKIIFKQNQESNLSINAYIYNFGIAVFEFIFYTDNFHPQFKTSRILEDKINLLIDEKLVEDPLIIYTHKFFIKIFQLPKIVPKLTEFSILDENTSEKLHQMIYKLSSLNTFYLKNEITLDVTNEIQKQIVIIDDNVKEFIEKKKKIHKIQSDNIIEQDNIYYCSEPVDLFMDDFKILMASDLILKGYRSHLMNWIRVIKEQIKSVKHNLNQTNKIYWERLKNTFETWDLNYLEFYSSVIVSLDFIQNYQYQSFCDEYTKTIKNDLNNKITAVLRNTDDVKYGLANLSTPCHAHDEQILQKETEKGNERIMLLSFLAMAIPLLGAILAPGISTITKIIAAVILFSFPLIYINFRKIQMKKSQKNEICNYLNNLKTNYLEQERYLDNLKNKIVSNKKISEKTKQESLLYLKLNLKSIQKNISDIDQQIENL